MRSLPLLVLSVGALGLAGCLGAATPEAQPTPTSGDEPVQPRPVVVPEAPAAPQPPPPSMSVFPYEGAITVSVGHQDVGYLSPTGLRDVHRFVFDVQEGAMGMVVELVWDASSTDLDLSLAGPSCETTTVQGNCHFQDQGTLGAGDSPARLVISDPALMEVGDWVLTVWGKNAVNAQFRGAITVFYGVPPPEGHSAL